MKRKLELTYVNKIKFERREEFDESLFADAYNKSARLVRRIVEENEGLYNNYTEEFLEYCTDEQINNIVAFLGGRGMGKSSAMLSFALFG